MAPLSSPWMQKTQHKGWRKVWENEPLKMKKIKVTIKFLSQLNWAQDTSAPRMIVLSCTKHQIFLGTEYKPEQCGYSKIQQICWQSSKQKHMMKKEVCGLQNMEAQIKQIK